MRQLVAVGRAPIRVIAVIAIFTIISILADAATFPNRENLDDAKGVELLANVLKNYVDKSEGIFSTKRVNFVVESQYRNGSVYTGPLVKVRKNFSQRGAFGKFYYNCEVQSENGPQGVVRAIAFDGNAYWFLANGVLLYGTKPGDFDKKLETFTTHSPILLNLIAFLPPHEISTLIDARAENYLSQILERIEGCERISKPVDGYKFTISVGGSESGEVLCSSEGLPISWSYPTNLGTCYIQASDWIEVKDADGNTVKIPKYVESIERFADGSPTGYQEITRIADIQDIESPESSDFRIPTVLAGMVKDLDSGAVIK